MNKGTCTYDSFKIQLQINKSKEKKGTSVFKTKKISV